MFWNAFKAVLGVVAALGFLVVGGCFLIVVVLT